MSDPKFPVAVFQRKSHCLVRQSLAVLLATSALGVVSAHAVDGTWVGASSSEWIDGTNWSSTPNVPDGTATFTNNAAPTTVDVNGLATTGTISFNVGAPAYTINTNDIFLVNGTGVINNGAALQTFNVSSSFTFQNASTASGGTGPVTYNNSGSISFLDTSTAGNATIVNNGVVQFFNNSTGGTSHITNNATWDFFDNSTSGFSFITNAAAGTMTFNNNASAGISIITNSGAMQFNNSSTAGNANISTTIGSFATITFNNTSSAGGSIISLVDGTLIFNNSATAGNTAISTSIVMPNATHPGIVEFHNSSTAGNAFITVVSSLGTGSGTLTFFDTSTAGNATITNNPGVGAGGQTFFGTLGGTDTANAGTAHITNNNMGATSFLAQTSASAATITNNSGGNTNFQDQSTAGSATIVNNSGGTTTFGVPLVGTDTATAASANIINHSGGTTAFFAKTTAGSATIINDLGGIVQFGDSGGANDTATAGNSTITNSGVVSFNSKTTAGSATITTNSGGNVFFFDTSTGGNARFITNAGGTVDISALTSAGTTAGSIAGAGNYVLGGKNFTVGSNNLSTTVSGVISGVGGSLTKVGAGALTLTNTNSYTGATTVSGGTLVIDGNNTASSLTTVNPGGTLAGSGTVGNTAIAGGTLAPGSAGNTFGPLTVAGSLTFTAASTYLIQVSPSNAGRTNVVGGTATLGGASVSANFLPGSYVDRQYTIVNATGGVVGTFNPNVVTNSPNIQSTLSYDANNAYLNIKLAFAPPPGGQLSINQQNVANTLTNFFNTTGSIPAAFAMLNAAGLTVASGELGTGIIQSASKADNLFLNLLLDPTIAGRAGGFAPVTGATRFAEDDEALAYTKRPATPHERDAYAMATKAPRLLAAQPLQRWSVWGAGYGGSARIGGDPVVLGSHDVSASAWGVAAGADYRISPDSLVGFALAGGGTNYSLSDNLGRGSSDLFQAGAFGRHNFGPAYISAALAYGWHDVTTNRTVALAGIDQLQARFRAETFSGRFEAGYRYAMPLVGLRRISRRRRPVCGCRPMSNRPSSARRNLR